MRAICVSALLGGALLFGSNLATFAQTASQAAAQNTPRSAAPAAAPAPSQNDGAAETPKAAYDFSLSREEKIKLAESAAPAEVSGKAAVYVLERTGYVKVRDRCAKSVRGIGLSWEEQRAAGAFRERFRECFRW